MLFDFNRSVRSRTVIIAVSLFLTLLANVTFFKNVLEVYELTWSLAPMIVSLAIVLWAVQVLLFTLLGSRYVLKPL